jgi:hypothetical protein
MSKQLLRLSRRQEKSHAQDTGGRVTPGSGNQDRKGDVEPDEHWLGELKQTSRPSRALKLSEWRTIEGHARKSLKEPYMLVELAGRKLVVLDYETWLVLRKRLF